jgi:hypothetical protein
LEIRAAKPDLVVSNLAGLQITNFLKQYSEFGLDFPVAGFGFDTAVAWGAGKGNFFGTWPLVWHHLIDTPGSKAFVAAFAKKYNKPPENQAWGDYITMKIIAQSMNEVKSTEAAKLIEHWEKGAKFDLLKTRPGYFRAWDHQLMHEMYAVEALNASELKNQWDIYNRRSRVRARNWRRSHLRRRKIPAPLPDRTTRLVKRVAATPFGVAVCKRSCFSSTCSVCSANASNGSSEGMPMPQGRHLVIAAAALLALPRETAEIIGTMGLAGIEHADAGSLSYGGQRLLSTHQGAMAIGR